MTLRAAQLATGSAVLNGSRQIGSVIGVGLLVAVLGHEKSGITLDRFQSGWTVLAIAAAAAAAAGH